MADSNDLVEVSELHFSHGDLSIFRGLSLKIPRGKVVAILGGSGSGKSTLLKLIGGQLAPARGWIRVDGKLVHKLDTDELSSCLISKTVRRRDETNDGLHGRK